MSTKNELDSVQQGFVLEFYLLRCAGIPSLVLHGEYDAETANEEIDLMIDSVGRLTSAPDDKRSKVIEEAMQAKSAVFRAAWFGGVAVTTH